MARTAKLKVAKVEPVTPVNPHVKLIEEFDKTVLSSVRQLWMEARDPKEKEKWRLKLDSALDERVRLMAKRDESLNQPQ